MNYFNGRETVRVPVKGKPHITRMRGRWGVSYFAFDHRGYPTTPGTLIGAAMDIADRWNMGWPAVRP